MPLGGDGERPRSAETGSRLGARHTRSGRSIRPGICADTPSVARPSRGCDLTFRREQAAEGNSRRTGRGTVGGGDGEVFGPEGGDARPGVGELLPGGGDTSVQLGDPRLGLGLGGPGCAFQASESLVALPVGLGQRGPGLLVLLPGIGGGALDTVFRVGGFGGTLRGGVERGPQRGLVVEAAARRASSFASLGGQEPWARHRSAQSASCSPTRATAHRRSPSRPAPSSTTAAAARAAPRSPSQ